MSPTSYQLLHPATLLILICLKYGAEDRGRTGTVISNRRILSPVRLPVPPLRQYTLAPKVGFEPTTYRLTVECSTIELLRNKNWLRPTFPGGCPPSIISDVGLDFCVRNGNRYISYSIVTIFLDGCTIKTACQYILFTLFFQYLFLVKSSIY